MISVILKRIHWNASPVENGESSVYVLNNNKRPLYSIDFPFPITLVEVERNQSLLAFEVTQRDAMLV